MEEDKLTLEEMLSLAEKVEDWTAEQKQFGYYPRKCNGSLGNISIAMDMNFKILSDDYSIVVRDKVTELEIGEYKSKGTKGDDEKIRQVYLNAKIKAEKNRQVFIDGNKEKALKYARDLLNK